MQHSTYYALSKVRSLIAQDLLLAQSDEDLRSRLANKGYALRCSAIGPILTTLPHGLEIGPLR